MGKTKPKNENVTPQKVDKDLINMELDSDNKNEIKSMIITNPSFNNDTTYLKNYRKTRVSNLQTNTYPFVKAPSGDEDIKMESF